MQGYDLQKLPNKFDFESKSILKKSITAGRALAELKGVSESIPNQAILINALALQEAKDSSEIENIITTHDELYRASVDDKKNIPSHTKEVQRYAEAIYYGFERVTGDQLLLTKHIEQMQHIIKQNNAGIRRQAGTVLKNDQTGEVLYTPPQDEATIRELLGNLERYINEPEMQDIDPLVKMAIIHYQFESIHPFYDGNGRVGRIINILYLVLNGLLDLPILYLSHYIIHNKSEYYRLLQAVRTDDTWEEWILYMLDSVEQTAYDTVKTIRAIKALMNNTKIKIREELGNIYSKDLLEALFIHPYTKIAFLEERLQIHRTTASNYLKSLEEIGILDGVKIGRSVYYINQELYELLRTGNMSDNS